MLLLLLLLALSSSRRCWWGPGGRPFVDGLQGVPALFECVLQAGWVGGAEVTYSLQRSWQMLLAGLRTGNATSTTQSHHQLLLSASDPRQPRSLHRQGWCFC